MRIVTRQALKSPLLSQFEMGCDLIPWLNIVWVLVPLLIFLQIVATQTETLCTLDKNPLVISCMGVVTLTASSPSERLMNYFLAQLLFRKTVARETEYLFRALETVLIARSMRIMADHAVSACHRSMNMILIEHINLVFMALETGICAQVIWSGNAGQAVPERVTTYTYFIVIRRVSFEAFFYLGMTFKTGGAVAHLLGILKCLIMASDTLLSCLRAMKVIHTVDFSIFLNKFRGEHNFRCVGAFLDRFAIGIDRYDNHLIEAIAEVQPHMKD